MDAGAWVVDALFQHLGHSEVSPSINVGRWAMAFKFATIEGAIALSMDPAFLHTITDGFYQYIRSISDLL